MGNIEKRINNMEQNLFDVESAIDIVVSKKEQDELYRKKNTLVKKIKKLKRRLNNANIEPTHRDYT
tara:strand:+ start:303 stop:500 length:198 start_codon:yes stop_codon:yes gene_type:complete